MNVLNEIGDLLIGGLADEMSVEDIAKKFNLNAKEIETELKMGVQVEMEHVNDKKLASEIAKDHLVEIPDYYSRLKEMENKAKEFWKDGRRKN